VKTWEQRQWQEAWEEHMKEVNEKYPSNEPKAVALPDNVPLPETVFGEIITNPGSNHIFTTFIEPSKLEIEHMMLWIFDGENWQSVCQKDMDSTFSGLVYGLLSVFLKEQMHMENLLSGHLAASLLR